MLFSEAVELYMGEKRAKLRANTIEGYESGMHCHVLLGWSK